jgi:ATP-dependent Clp protease ATP-binding subunit ClpB
LNENLRTNDTEFKDLELEFDKKIKAHIFKHGIDEDFGARPLKRCIEKEISTPLAVRLLRGDISINATVLVTMRNAKVDFNIIEPEVKEEVTVVSTC